MKTKSILRVLFAVIFIATVVYFAFEMHHAYLDGINDVDSKAVAFYMTVPFLCGTMVGLSELMLFSDIWYFIIMKEKTFLFTCIHAVALLSATFIIAGVLISYWWLKEFKDWEFYLFGTLILLKMIGGLCWLFKKQNNASHAES